MDTPLWSIFTCIELPTLQGSLNEMHCSLY